MSYEEDGFTYETDVPSDYQEFLDFEKMVVERFAKGLKQALDERDEEILRPLRSAVETYEE